MRHLPILLSLLMLPLSGCEGDSHGVALGTLERDRIAHVATSSEVVVALPVEPGSEVKAGDLLVQLDDTLQQAQLDKAAAEVAQAKASLAKLRHGARPEEVAAGRARVAGAQAALVESEASYTRIRNLADQHAVSQADLDKARASRDANQAALLSAEEDLAVLTNGARAEDLEAAQAALDAALATQALENKRLADLRVTATRSGLLDTLPWNLGERVTAGSPVAIVLAGKAPFARIYVPEPYRARLHPGDQLTVHVDGIDDSFSGRLRWISTEPAFTPYYALNQEERARLMYLAEVQLPDSQAGLPIGIPVQVDMP